VKSDEYPFPSQTVNTATSYEVLREAGTDELLPGVNAEAVPNPLALIIDDESKNRRLLGICLRFEGYKVLEASTGKEGINQVAQHQPDVVILGSSLPDMEGITMLKLLREWSGVPVVVLSACGREESKIAALDNGADDYITIPFSTAELMARLRAARRHVALPSEKSRFRTGALEMDFAARVVKFKGKEVKLTATEYAMLKLFARHVGKVLTHRQILREVWGPAYVERKHYLRVYMAHLREKLETHPAKPGLLMNEPGVGYWLERKE
jgi:two-component system KDP operon response regulator KdpE